MSKKLTVSCHIDGARIESLSVEQLESLGREVSQVMSNYYSCNKDEFLKIQGEQKRK
jgi:hypothetical protein